MLASALGRLLGLFQGQAGDVDSVYCRALREGRQAWLSDRQLYAALRHDDPALEPLHHEVARGDKAISARALLEHLRTRRRPQVLAVDDDPAARLALLHEEREWVLHTVAWADQICNRTFCSLTGLPISLGESLDWYSDLAGKSWFFEHVRGMREKMAQRIPERLRLAPVRATWELNSLQHLVELGKACWLTGDERYASHYVQQTMHWQDKNPPGMGIAWADDETVARRAVSLVLAWHLLVQAPPVTPELAVRHVKTLLMHAACLADALGAPKRAVAGSAAAQGGTSRLGLASALFMLALELGDFEPAAGWRSLALSQLLPALRDEVGWGGSHRSGSVERHRYACEWMLLVVWLARLNFVRLEDELTGLARDAFRFLVDLQEPDGRYQSLGLRHPERVLPWGAAFQSDLPGLLSLAAVALECEDLRQPVRPGWTLLWMGGADAADSYRSMYRRFGMFEAVREHPGAGLVILRGGASDKDLWASLRYIAADGAERAAVPGLDAVGEPSGSKGPQRVHDDLLHISLAVGGARIFTDPGALLFESPQASWFDAPWSHNTLLIRDATPLGAADGGLRPGEVRCLDDGRIYVNLGARAWRRGDDILWHQREVLFDPRHDSFSICDQVEGSSEGVDLEVGFHTPLDIEIVQRGDLGCIFWRRLGLLRLHPFFSQPFRGNVERGRESTPPLGVLADGATCEPLQRVRFSGRVTLPVQQVFWMTWNVAGANTPQTSDAVGAFAYARSARTVRPARGGV